MIAYTLALAGLGLFLVNPTLGAGLFAIGCLASRSWRVARSELPELILFYGALAGCVVSFAS